MVYFSAMILKDSGLFRVRSVPVEHREPIQSVAVLPFTNLNPDPEDGAHLSIGIGHALLRDLTKIPDLRITPMRTSGRYAGSPQPLPEIAMEMNVEALVIGNYRLQEDRIQGTVSLVDSVYGSVFWADSFDARYEDFLPMVNRLAAGIAHQLRGNEAGGVDSYDTRTTPRSAEAYDLYLRGSERFREGNRQSLESAISFFRKALELDPGLYEAHIGLGDVNSHLYLFGCGGGWNQLLESVRNFREALRLNPGSIEARRGLIRMSFQEGLPSEKVLQLGQEIETLGRTDPQALLARGEAYLFGGLHDRSIQYFHRVLALEPGNDEAIMLLTMANAWAGRFQESIDWGEKFFLWFGYDHNVHMWVGFSYHALDDLEPARLHYESARRILENKEITVFYIPLLTGVLYHQLDEPKELQRVMSQSLRIVTVTLSLFPDSAIQRSESAIIHALSGNRVKFQEEETLCLEVNPGNGSYQAIFALLHAFLGETETAMKLFRESLEAGFVNPLYRSFMKVMDLDPLRSLPEFREFEKRFGEQEKRLQDAY